MRSTIIKIRDGDLDADGRWLLNSMRHQDRHLQAILTPRDGLIYAEINNEDTDDILRVRVADSLSYSQRALQYGIAGLALTPDRWSGQRSEYGGDPIPTPAWAARLEQMYAHPQRTRPWYIPDHLIRRARQQPDTGAAIINAAGSELRQWLQAGGFTLWHDPDWLGLTDAAEVAGVPLKTIQNAVRAGQLRSWTDVDEPNPRRRTRVHRADIAQRWSTRTVE